ncbi:MAG: hypothetical protein U0797_16845 [Gemmataceae bacterium]
MLGEWLERLWTTCPPHLRDMGCLREMLGLRRRHRWFRRAWEPHCSRSRRLVLDAAGRCGRRRRAVVFGSGWLHDVPLDELAAMFEEVILVDLFHPLAVRWRARKYRNVRLVADDVTGVLGEVWRAGFERRGSSPPSGPPGQARRLDTPPADLAVSLNLLSQLPCMAESYLLRCRSHTSGEILAWGRDVIRAHLAYLESLPGVVALVTDVAVRTAVRPAEKGTLFGVELPYEGETWEWSLVPGAETLRVVGVVDIKDPTCRRSPGGSA